MKASLGLIPRDKGEVTFDRQKVDKIRKDIAYVPQRSDIDWDFPITVIDTVLIGRYPKLGLFRRPKKRSEEHTSELQSRGHLVCRLLLEKKNTPHTNSYPEHHNIA